jgi:hypothetical protein
MSSQKTVTIEKLFFGFFCLWKWYFEFLKIHKF